MAAKDVKSIMVGVPHHQLIPALFHLIWTKIRNESAGDGVGMPDWPLKVGPFILILLILFRISPGDFGGLH